jgi:hypothetical protein
MADNIVGTKIIIESAQAIESVGSIKKQLREANAELIAIREKFGEGSREAAIAAQKVGKLKDSIADAKSQADAFNPDAKFKAFSQSLQGVAGGFAAVQGAMAVFGVESEDLQKTLVKVQGALALSEGLNTFLDTGIQGFKNLISVIQNSTVVIKANEIATKAAAVTMRLFGIEVETTSVAFNVLKGAIAATGIGLLVVGLGQAISYFDKLSNSAQEAANKQKEFNKTIKEGAKFELDELLKSLDNQMRIDVSKAKARNASEQEIFNIEQSYRRRKTEAQIRYYNEIKKIDTQAAKDASNDIAKSNADGIVARNERIAADRKEREEKAKKDKERRDEELKKEKEHEDAKNKLFEDFKLLNKKRDEDQLVELDNQLKEETQLNKEAKDQQAKDDAFLRTERLKGEIQVAKTKEELIEKEKALEKQRFEESLKWAMTYAQSAQGLSDALYAAKLEGVEKGSKEEQEILKKQFETNKKIQIAQTIISGLNGVVNALSAKSVLPEPFGAIARGVNATMIGATTAATISKIAQTQFGGTTGSMSVSGGVGGNAPMTPSVPIQQTVTQLNQGTINALGNQAIKAYVLESDVTNSQNRVTRILNSSRFK